MVVITSSHLMPELRQRVALLEDDLRQRVEPTANSEAPVSNELLGRWQADYAQAVDHGRTTAAWIT